jgi:hypothetical protein
VLATVHRLLLAEGEHRCPKITNVGFDCEHRGRLLAPESRDGS